MRLSAWIHILCLTIGLGLGIGLAAPARAEYLRAETEHFVIQGDVSRRDITEYARKVERFHEMLKMFSPPETDEFEAPKLWIYLAANNAMLRQAWPDAAQTIGGYYSRNNDGIYAVVDLSNDSSDITLFHEYAHHYMFQYHNKAYPAWFVEGFAEYFAPSDLRMGQIRYGLWREARLYAIDAPGPWVPMEVLLSERPNLGSRQGALYYSQAWLLTHYMLGEPSRHEQLARYLVAVQNGEDSVAAFQQHSGQTPAQLEASLRTYRQRGMSTFRLTQDLPVAQVTVTSLPASTRDAVWLNLRVLREKGDDWDRTMTRVRAMSARHPGDHLATVTLAKYLLKSDLPAEAVSALEPIVAANPDSAEALWLLATAEMDLADLAEDDAARAALTRQAQRHLGAAYQADPLDYRIYMAMTRNREGAPGFPSDNDLTIAASAYRLAPQLGSTAMRAAQLLMSKGQYLEAVLVLTPLANSAHGGGETDTVRTLLASARERAGLAPIGSDLPPVDEQTEPAAG